MVIKLYKNLFLANSIYYGHNYINCMNSDKQESNTQEANIKDDSSFDRNNNINFGNIININNNQDINITNNINNNSLSRENISSFEESSSSNNNNNIQIDNIKTNEKTLENN